MKTTKKPSITEPKVSDPSVHIVDVNMVITKRKVTKYQVFKDKKPIKKKNCFWLKRKTKTIAIFCQDNTRDASKRPTKKYELKGENTMEYKLGRITRGRDAYKTNCTTNFFYYF